MPQSFFKFRASSQKLVGFNLVACVAGVGLALGSPSLGVL